MRRRAITIGVLALVLLTLLIFIGLERFRAGRISVLVGAVLQQDADPKRQVPLSNARIVALDGPGRGECRSGESGLFRLHLRPALSRGDSLSLRVEHPGYQPLTLPIRVADRIYILHLAHENTVRDAIPPILVSNMRVRYAEKLTTTVNVGAIAKTFEVINKGNVPCTRGSPCSPDGKWRAAIGGASFDAGSGNRIRNVRVSCFAGPCPFSNIETQKLSDDHQSVHVTVRDWSDTVTYLVEAEVVRTLSADKVQHLYPIVFGRFMNFTLPPSSQGPCIEATLGGDEIVFPLPPALEFSWGKCSMQTARNNSEFYQCELKPGYRFQ